MDYSISTLHNWNTNYPIFTFVVQSTKGRE